MLSVCRGFDMVTLSYRVVIGVNFLVDVSFITTR